MARNVQVFCLRVDGQSFGRAVCPLPVSGDDNNLSTLPDECTERFRKGEIPAHEDADSSKRGFNDSVLFILAGRGQMRPLGMPKVFFGI